MNFIVQYYDWECEPRVKCFSSEHEAFEFMRLDKSCMYVFDISIVEVEK